MHSLTLVLNSYNTIHVRAVIFVTAIQIKLLNSEITNEEFGSIKARLLEIIWLNNNFSNKSVKMVDKISDSKIF